MENKPRLRATAEEFEQLLRGETVKLSLDTRESLCVLKDDEIIISNLIVEGSIKLTNVYPYDIHLKGNTLLGHFIISGKAQTENFFISENAETENFFISGEAQTEDFRIFDEAQTGSFSIFGEAQTGNFFIYANAKTKDFLISGEAQTKDFSIFDEAQTKDFIIFGEAKTGNFSISGKFNKTGNFKIYKKAQTGNFKIYEKAETRDFIISGEAKTGNFSISGKFNKTRDFSIFGAAKLKTLSISGKKKMGTLRIGGKTCFDTINIKDVQQGNMHLYGARLNGQLKILNSEFEQIEIQGTSSIQADKISIESTSVSILKFVNAHMVAAPVQITGLEPPKVSKGTTYLEFTRSSFKDLEMINNKFDRFDFMVFEDSNIAGSFISQTQFPKHIQSADPEVGQDPYQCLKVEEDKDQAKLFYEQIKTAYSKHGNRTEALHYQAKELDMYFTNLNWTYRFWDKLFWDKITLFFHKYTTHFGTQWIRGFLVLLGSTVILYTLTLWSTEEVTWTWPWLMRCEDFWSYYTHYIEFLNPTTNLLGKWNYIYELEGIKPNDTSKHLGSDVTTLLLFSKVVIVTLIYQIIQAFRKFGRS